jgi:uncharacterized protein (TIGR03067 family)
VLRTSLAGFAVVLVFSPLARCDAPKSEGDAKALRGTWLPSSAALAGREWSEQLLKSMRLELTDGHYTVTVNGRPDKGTCKIDTTKKPKTLDITGTDGPNKGRTILCIYEINGDTLKVCYDMSGKRRPTEFQSRPDSQLFLVTYRREKH